MKNTKNRLLLTAILLSLPLFFSGCEKKSKDTDTTLPVANSTEIIGGQESDISQDDTSVTEGESAEEPVQQAEPSDQLLFKKSNGATYTLIMQNGKLLPDPQSKPILLINLFDIHDHASAAQAPYLTKLQKEYSNRLTVLGIPTNQSMDEAELKAFINQHKIDYFVSYESGDPELINLFLERLKSDGLTTPTTLLYHQGETGPIYEGAVPIEMIRHDILMITKE
ncbi:MAG: hypothetical protein ABXS91_02325 [Sulfurimonas sp.]